MTIKLKVPSIVCAACAETVTQAVIALDKKVSVKVDVETKMLTVEGPASEEAVKQAVVDAGHTVE